MQNFTKEQAKNVTETTTANRGYWGYHEMTAAEIQQTTGAGCGGCGGCGGESATFSCDASGAAIGSAIGGWRGAVIGTVWTTVCNAVYADNGEGDDNGGGGGEG
jgi:hypothetical protein